MRYSEQWLVDFLERKNIRPTGIWEKDIEQAKRFLPKGRGKSNEPKNNKARS